MLSDPNAKIYRVDSWNEEEQRYEIDFNGKRYELSYTNYDELGSEGMSAVADVIVSIATLFNIPIEDWDCEGSGQEQPELHNIS